MQTARLAQDFHLFAHLATDNRNSTLLTLSVRTHVPWEHRLSRAISAILAILPAKPVLPQIASIACLVNTD